MQTMETIEQAKAIRRSRSILAFQTAVKDVLSAAESYRSTSAAMEEAFHALKSRYNVPDYSWHWARGYRDCRIDAWYRYNLCFCYVIDGQIVEKGWDAMTEEQREFCRQGKNVIGGHWWKDQAGNPILNRPFFVTKDTRQPKDPVTGHYPLSEVVTDQFVG